MYNEPPKARGRSSPLCVPKNAAQDEPAMTVQIPQSESLSRVRVVEGNGAPADVALETLEEQIFPSLLEENISDGPLRLWVPGCSTGEDAYLLAACLLEFLADRGAERDFKLFPSVADRDHPATLSFLGYDERGGQLIHIHLHFLLIVGERLLKNYRIPWEEVLHRIRSRSL